MTHNCYVDSQKPKGKKVEIAPWEAALVSSAISNKEKKKQEAAQKQREADEARQVPVL